MLAVKDHHLQPQLSAAPPAQPVGTTHPVWDRFCSKISGSPWPPKKMFGFLKATSKTISMIICVELINHDDHDDHFKKLIIYLEMNHYVMIINHILTRRVGGTQLLGDCWRDQAA